MNAPLVRTHYVEIVPKLLPVFSGPADVRGAFGGRGSGKTHSFAKMTAVRAHQLACAGEDGVIICGREHAEDLDESSMAEVKAAIRSMPWLEPHFEIGEKFIRTRNKRIRYSFEGLRYGVDGIKSKNKIHIMWIDEAERVSETAWAKAIPSIRTEKGELWVTWNPEREASATHQRFRAKAPADAKIVQVNYNDNPWFPERLNRTRLDDMANRPDDYGHIWLGDFRTYQKGAYYAKHLAEAKANGRVTAVTRDPLMQIYAIWDIGGTGQKADACAIWIVQFVGMSIRVLNYYEAVGQPLETHVNWLRENGYAKAQCVLPHDGVQGDKVFAVTYESALRQAGFPTTVIPNMGPGAAMMRVRVTQRYLPAVWFNAETTKAGMDALAWYHPKVDEARDINLGPDHDWSSHAADAFGLACVFFDKRQPSTQSNWDKPLARAGAGVA